MRRFREHIRGTLNVFDIDETLFRTFAKIKVVKDGRVVKMLNNKTFNTYRLRKGEHYDFAEFRDAQHFKNTSKPIHNMIEKAKSIIANQTGYCKTILLTARADFDDRDTFLQTFRDHNFPIDDVYVERAGNLTGRYSSRPNIAKLATIRKYIGTNQFNKVRIYDDSESNLRTIAKLIHLHPEIELEAYLVLHDGSIRRYE